MRYDAIVIGAGQAGPYIAESFGKKGQRVALIEGGLVGGTCLNYGCRPTKALRASARIAHLARHSEKWGVQTGHVKVDFQAVMQRKDDIISHWQEGHKSHILDLENVDFYQNYARFEPDQGDYHRIRAGEDTILEAKRIYLNVGARALIPDIEGLHEVPYLTNQELLEVETPPGHLMIMGGGYIGLEFGQMFRRFGSEVTIIEEADRVLDHEDPDITNHIENIVKADGVEILTGYEVTKVELVADGCIEVTARNNHRDENKTINGTHLLAATGRIPNSDRLNINAVGLETDDDGYITVNGKLETNIPGIWALGDVNGRGAFTHTAYRDHEILLANEEGGNQSVNDRIMTYSVFIDPPLGRVGMSEQDARESGKNVLIATYEMENLTRGVLDGETQGMIKLLVDADTEKFLGAAALCMQGDDVIQVVSYFMHTGASYKIMENALPIHPTVSEFFPTILKQLKPLDE